MVNSTPPFDPTNQDAWPWAVGALGFGWIIGLDKIKNTESQMRTAASRIARINRLPIVPNLKENLYLKSGIIRFLDGQHHRGENGSTEGAES